MKKALPIPPYFDPQRVGEVWKVPYQTRAAEAAVCRNQFKIKPAAQDRMRICLMLVDVQNTFCIPGYELFVGGRSGIGAVEDNRRLCEFIYRNLDCISEMCPTLDTHQALQIFHSIFLVDKNGEHPPPFTLVSVEDVQEGRWRFNPELSQSLDVDKKYGQRLLEHYVQKLHQGGKYDLTIWPYHAMLGGIGHAVVSAVEEAIFFHSIARYAQPDYQIKGNNPLTENYSVLSPEVVDDHEGSTIAHRNTAFVQKLLQFDAVIIAGQAKSHCIAWTIDDLLKSIQMSDIRLAQRVYLLEDCMSSVVIPEVIDYTETADQAFERFAAAGMHIVKSTTPIREWPGLKLK
ncbi:MAG: isochorismatase [bacterium]